VNEGVRNIGGIDRMVHEPGRLMIVALLYAVKQADFLYLQHETALNKGTLSSHLARLEEAGYVSIEKTFQGKMPRTLLQLTAAGRTAFEKYRRDLKRVL
jgi:DNA-binding MarR family transcriptional regulator